jgi:hypothetical protein
VSPGFDYKKWEVYEIGIIREKFLGFIVSRWSSFTFFTPHPPFSGVWFRLILVVLKLFPGPPPYFSPFGVCPHPALFGWLATCPRDLDIYLGPETLIGEYSLWKIAGPCPHRTPDIGIFLVYVVCVGLDVSVSRRNLR